MSKEEKVKDKDGKGSGGCCGTFFGCSIIFLIIIILFILFVVKPMWSEYGDDIKSTSVYDKLRNMTADKVEEFNDKYIRGVSSNLEDMKENADDAIDKVKGKSEEIIEKSKEIYNNPEVIIENADDMLPEPLIDDNFQG